MTNTSSIVSKVLALMLFPALALGMFAAPAMAFAFGSFGGVMTVVDVTNVNTANVMNAISVKSDTGDNTANGGDGGESGESGNSGDGAGEGGDGGDGGKAEAERGGEKAYAESGLGGDAGEGGSTGNTGHTGNGGYGGLGGQIATGDAFASVVIGNDINSNETMVTIDDACECDRYNEYFESANKYFERNRESWSIETSEGNTNDWFRNWNKNDTNAYAEDSSSDSLLKDSRWEIYTKTYVPVTTVVGVENINAGSVVNAGGVEAETGDNTSNGGNGEDAGDSGDSGDEAGEGGDGGEGGKAEAEGSTYKSFMRWSNDSEEAVAIADNGGAGGNGGDTGNTGNTGTGGNGAEGGLIVTGHADSLATIVNVLNRNVTRIVR